MEYRPIKCRHLLKKPDKATPFNCSYVISPYSGCEYGCVYCHKCREGELSRDSPKSIQVKVNAPSILKKELKSAEMGVVCIIGYQPVEKEYRVVRKILEMLSARRFPVHIITKSVIVLDDLDLLSRISERSWCAVTFCIATLDEDISTFFEPDTPSSKKRLETIKKVAEAGIVTGMALMPIIPYITDSEEQLEDVISTAKEVKARYVLPVPLTLEDDCRVGFINVIKRHFPKLLIKYRRLYEFGSAPEVRYSRRLKNKTNALLKNYNISDIIPISPTKGWINQVNIDDFLPNNTKSRQKG